MPFFACLSVSKTHFTDKPLFTSDLSVNFWPLWWGFTDKAGFFEHLSVKPGPKRLNFYGQTAIFAHFVRNRHFSGRPFTDKFPIFIDVSVIGSDFPNAVPDKSTYEFAARLFSAISIISCMQKNRIRFAIDCKSSVFLIWGIVSSQTPSGAFFSSSIANQNAKSLDFRHLFFAKAW